ncbi:MAG: hypothetical protein KF841_00270 [Phycisphaerae bacterium]|nr:hypothetical protein [Phycisphaerae bacterium]
MTEIIASTGWMEQWRDASGWIPNAARRFQNVTRRERGACAMKVELP